MKIAILTFEVAPLSGRLEIEAKTLIQQGHQVHVIYARVPAGKARQPRTHGEYRESLVGSGAASRRGRTVALPRVLARILDLLRSTRPEVVHCAHPLLLPAALRFKRSCGAKLVYDAYEFYSVMWSECLPFARTPFRRLAETVEERWAAKADLILTVDTADDVLEERYRRVNPRVSTLCNVPRLADSADPALVEKLRARYQGARVIAYVGGIFEHKGMSVLVDAVALARRRVPDIRLLLIGRVGDSERLYAAADQASGTVEILPWLPYEEMLAYLKVAKVGLAPYPAAWHYPLARGGARKIFTYMQAGLPIVAPEFGGIAQLLRDEQCGLLVDTGSPQRIADAIVQLLSEPDLATEMGGRGRKAFLERYNWDKEQRKLLEAYASLGAIGSDAVCPQQAGPEHALVAGTNHR